MNNPRASALSRTGVIGQRFQLFFDAIARLRRDQQTALFAQSRDCQDKDIIARFDEFIIFMRGEVNAKYILILCIPIAIGCLGLAMLVAGVGGMIWGTAKSSGEDGNAVVAVGVVFAVFGWGLLVFGILRKRYYTRESRLFEMLP